METIPRERNLDSSLALLREGYEFIPNRCRRYASDIFETRLVLERTICMQGAEAARVFYGEHLTRRRALPAPILTLLQDKGSVQLLDGDPHRHRKAMLLSLMSPEALEGLAALATAEWETSTAEWPHRRQVVLLKEVEALLCRTACAWVGIPLTRDESTRRARDLTALIDGAGSFGPRNWRGQLARRRAEQWVERLIRAIRSGALAVPDERAASVIASHRDLDGRLLDEAVATVELINILRPIVAVARFAVFEALALHEHSRACAELDFSSDADREAFVHEVRRYYPFFPAVAARVATLFTWRGHQHPPGRRVLLDIYGTHRDPRIWDDPKAFEPLRFRAWKGDAFTLIPQGGGSHEHGHRCAGEWATITLMKVAAGALTQQMTYTVPAQDLRVSLARMPAQPESGFVVSNVRHP